uniref:Cyclin-dependent kinase inhibitor domain-containing protein n=1 Tax=Ditylenchus dipsaci TaxID=166011 RepID=A0A915D7S3_9BILA
MQVLACHSPSHPTNKVHQPTTPRSARRCLFGSASSTDSNDQFVKRLLAEIHDNYKAKWEFDFLSGQPISSQKPEEAKFVYTPLAEEQVPGFYRLSSYCQPSKAFHCIEEDSENVHPLNQSAQTSSPLLNDSTSASSMDGSFEVSVEKQEVQCMEVSECVPGHSDCDDQDTLLKTSPVVRRSLSATITPKKQAKLTDFLPQRRKNLQRSAKKSDWKTKRESGCDGSCCPTSPTKTVIISSPTKVAISNRRRSTVGARLAAAASLRNQQ